MTVWFSSTVGNVGTKQRGVLQKKGWRGSSEQAPVDPPGQKNLWVLQCTHREVLVLHCKHLFFSFLFPDEWAQMPCVVSSASHNIRSTQAGMRALPPCFFQELCKVCGVCEQLPQLLHFSSLQKIKQIVKVETKRKRGEMSMSLA